MQFQSGSELMLSVMEKLSGHSLIGFQEGRGTGVPLYARDPTTGQQLQPGFIPATAEEVDRAVQLAADAFKIYSRTSGRERGAFLRKIAASIEAIAADIIERAVSPCRPRFQSLVCKARPP